MNYMLFLWNERPRIQKRDLWRAFIWRAIIVFEANNSDLVGEGNDNFAFISNGMIIVNGTGTLQVFDILGHELFNKQLSVLPPVRSVSPKLPPSGRWGLRRSGFRSPFSVPLFSSGVYVLRLTNGETMKTQKIVLQWNYKSLISSPEMSDKR